MNTNTVVAKSGKPRIVVTRGQKAEMRRKARTATRAVLVEELVEDMASVRVIGPKGAFTLSPIKVAGGAIYFVIKIKGEVVTDKLGNRQLFTIGQSLVRAGEDLFLQSHLGTTHKKVKVSNVWRYRRPRCGHRGRCACKPS